MNFLGETVGGEVSGDANVVSQRMNPYKELNTRGT